RVDNRRLHSVPPRRSSELDRPGWPRARWGSARVRDVLAEMRIQGLGVIDDATLELHPGLTVITGETGAGKTMVVTGLHLLSGGRDRKSTRLNSSHVKISYA